MRQLPERVWRMPRQEGDEAADEGIGRVLALSDGVFAIAITLLILDIAIPATTSSDRLPGALLALWPRYLAFALSFLVISRFWVIHRQAFVLIARDDPALAQPPAAPFRRVSAVPHRRHRRAQRIAGGGGALRPPCA